METVILYGNEKRATDFYVASKKKQGYSSGMTLQEFKAAHKLTLPMLAELLKLRPATCNAFFYGVRKPDIEHIEAIVKATRGAVTARDLRPDLARLFA